MYLHVEVHRNDPCGSDTLISKTEIMGEDETGMASSEVDTEMMLSSLQNTGRVPVTHIPAPSKNHLAQMSCALL